MVTLSLRVLPGNLSVKQQEWLWWVKPLSQVWVKCYCFLLAHFCFRLFLESKKVEDNFTVNLIGVWNQSFGIGYITSANIHKIRSLIMFYILILEGRDCTAPITMKSQLQWETICIVQSNSCCDSRQNNAYSRDSRNLFILRWYQCLSLFDSAMTQQYTTCLRFTQKDGDPNLSSSVLLQTVSAQMDSVAYLDSLEKLGSKGPYFVNTYSFSWLSLWPLAPAAVWNGSTVLMLQSTGWGFPAQPDASCPVNLSEEPAYVC